MRRRRVLLLIGWTITGWLLSPERPSSADTPLPKTVEYNRDIRPILSDNCYACHGPDQNQRKAKLRLDTEEGAFADRGGYKPLVAGKPDESELLKRITATDPSERMPPPKSGKHLTPRQIDLIRRWIEQGAKWQKHWSLIVPKRPEISKAGSGSPRNAIDHFILARLEPEGLKPSAEADRRTLIRRLSFDVTGLPPSPQEVDAFIADKSSQAYEKLVDHLLMSPHYGERMAVYWLDVVRFADTIGYHTDNPRNISPYRDYVIQSFNGNKPFDQFTVEQLAGDLLPNPTLYQKVASAYNRLLQTTEEGGAQPKEYRAKYAADRVRNASATWLGLTMGCCECHDHKFDPLATREFYRFAAFFADIQEEAVANFIKPDRGILVPSPEQADELNRREAKVKEALKKLNSPSTQAATAALYTRTLTPFFDPTLRELIVTGKALVKWENQIARCQITVSGTPRETRILRRGNWMDDSGELVTPEVPLTLGPLGAKDKRATRLDLARWVVSRNNSLTARVFVNRLWKLFFGHGLCRSMEDFGAQGELPTHPDLLDWLAVEFMDSGWNVKHVVRLMVTSASYRQSSSVDKKLRERDPDNRLFARQSRFRLDAEFVRDNALAISGMLSRRVGGASVKPYQPAGYWEFLNFPKRTYKHDQGEKQYRRGLYTHWQRTFLHPSMVAFDAPTREECTAERARSNIPQQALVLLNDPTYVEAARVFAEQIIKRGGKNANERFRWAYRQALSRSLQPEEERMLMELLNKHADHFSKDGKAAEQLAKSGESPLPPDLPASELAAWTSVARVILNLHETITRY